MPTARDWIRHMIGPAWIVGLMLAPLMLGSIGPAQAAEDLFESLAVQRPAQPEPAPDLALAALKGGMANLKDFRGKVILLGFFTTT